MRGAIFAAALVLAVLHHDVWFFHDSRLVFGFVPIGLFWHALYSVLAALLWWVAVEATIHIVVSRHRNRRRSRV